MERLVDKLRRIYDLTLRQLNLKRKCITTKNKPEMSRSFCSSSQSFPGGQSFCSSATKDLRMTIRAEWILRGGGIHEVKYPPASHQVPAWNPCMSTLSNVDCAGA